MQLLSERDIVNLENLKRGECMLNFMVKDAIETRIMIGEDGKNLKQFAYKIGISQAYLSQIIGGKRNPSPVVANKIAEGLGREIRDIFFIQTDNKCNNDEKR